MRRDKKEQMREGDIEIPWKAEEIRGKKDKRYVELSSHVIRL